ncbi:MAG TPA: FecR family protein, partial [Puia sp.]|nr:FecR family protein [Puia sp.]
PKPPNKIKPGTQKAMLTLADGTVVALDSTANGKIAQQGATQVVKLASGQIRYQAANATDEEGKDAYNVMSTPMGGQYQLTLPDGSNVWLNAGSSITYPTAFPGNKREVKITGEVYFEVAKDKNKTFRVTTGDQEIEVLGTHFNINAYADEDHIKTSLLQGAVKVNKVLLQPGQAFTHGKVEPTNVDQDIAWKNGVFNFNNQTLAQVMRQLARWYDLEIVYPQGIPKKEYGGEIGRNLTLDQVLKGLENSGIHFQLNGRRLIVKS